VASGKVRIMDSESTGGRTLSLDLPAALDEWLADRAAELDVDESELVLQLVGSYRVAADADDGTAAELADTIDEDAVDVEEAVRGEVEDALAGATVDEDAIIRQAETQMSERADALEAEFDEKLDDVRRRVVQLKGEVGGKASADHDHEAFERLDELAAGLGEVRAEIQKLQETGEGDDLAARVSDLEGKLDTLARVVVRLRDAPDDVGDETLMKIKRAAARRGADEARCENCGETVSIGLLPEAECPHCRSPFGGLVEGSGGVFGSPPRLVGPGERGGTEPDGGAADDGEVGSELSDLGTDEGSGVDPGGGGDGAVSTDGGDR
jgi:Zn finger protein HypA/HybF involved in hydrogenase expression